MALFISLLAAIALSPRQTQNPDQTIHAKSGAIEPRLLLYPTIHGNTVVFSDAGDLWSANLNGGNARRLTSGYGNKVYPFFSPDGKRIAFTAYYDGVPDVYIIPSEGGVPKRLTFDSFPDTVLGWTPDGKIAYKTATTSPTMLRQSDMWLIDPDGGLPQATPIHEVGYASFFSEGDKIAYNRQNSFLFNWRRYRGGSQGFVSFYNLKTNEYSELPHGREQSYYPMAVGNDVYYVSDKGDGVLNLYVTRLTNHETEKLTHFTGEDIKWANTDGKSVAVLEDGYIWVYNIADKTLKQFEPHIASDELNSRPLLHHLGTDIANISISPSGKRIAVEARGEIFSVPTHTGVTRDMTNTQGTRERMPAWAPDGQSVAYISDATGESEIYTSPQLGGTPTQITKLGATITNIGWFPDGKKIIFQTLDNGLYYVDLDTKNVVKVDMPDYGIGGVDVSPDSKWIAFTEGKVTSTTILKLYNIETAKTSAITNGMFQDSEVSFDKNGKYLYLISARTFMPTPGLFGPSLKIDNAQRVYAIVLAKATADPFMPKDDEEPAKETPPSAPPQGPPPGTPPHMPPPGMAGTRTPPLGMRFPGMMPPREAPSPTVIDIGGLAERIVPLPLPPDNYHGLIGTDDGVLFFSGPTLLHFTMATKHATPVIAGPISSIDVNPSGTMLAYYGGGVLGEVSLEGPPATFGEGAIDTSGVEYIIDPRAEWNEIYWEAYRFIRDHYYDKNFRGQDWKTVGDHYAGYLKWVNSRSDLDVVLGYLLSELGTSHSYVENPGDLGPMPAPAPIGYLGADYVESQNHIQFKNIYRGDTYSEADQSPLALPGINVTEGDYLLAIDGQPLDGHTNPDSLLIDKIGKLVTITVNSSPSMEGAKSYQVRPISTEVQLRYDHFLHQSADLVNKLSGGRIGYMHIRDTAAPGSQDFARGFWAQTDKDALIIDERWNGGGYPSPGFITELSKKLVNMGQSRIGGDSPLRAAMSGPEAMLINGYAGSGGDLFPWTFKQEKLGPLVGERTWGGLVGIGAGANLVDGGSISTPTFSIFTPDTNEIIAENHGIDPDITVDARPDLVAKGEDPQLEAAIKYLMDELQKLGPTKKRTQLPIVSKEGRLDLPGNAPFGK